MEMKIIEDGDCLCIEGPGKERGRIAYASEQDGRLVFTLTAIPANEPNQSSLFPDVADRVLNLNSADELAP